MMKIFLLLLLIDTAKAITSGLTAEEIAAFKPIDPDRVEQNTGVKGEVSITDPGSGETYLTVYTNGIPTHDDYKWPRADEVRPIYVNVTKTAFTIPKEPKLRDTPLMCVPFGIVGVATGGVMIYNAYTPRKYCPIAFLVEAFDMCTGHPDPAGGYHYHSHSTCNTMEVCGEPSKIFGVALDGIPIYGPFDENGKQLIQEDLDICGGRVDKDGRYKYHVTADPPYLLNCFKGEIHKDFLKTSYPTRDTFTCTCPFDDSGFPECFEDVWCEDDDKDGYTTVERTAAEKAYKEQRRSMPRKPKICDWENINGDFATCTDILNKSYVAGFKQIKKTSTLNLIACCPKGKDCGSSCTDNTDCYVESRTGMFLETVIVDSAAVVVHLTSYTMVALVSYLIL